MWKWIARFALWRGRIAIRRSLGAKRTQRAVELVRRADRWAAIRRWCDGESAVSERKPDPARWPR